MWVGTPLCREWLKAGRGRGILEKACCRTSYVSSVLSWNESWSYDPPLRAGSLSRPCPRLSPLPILPSPVPVHSIPISRSHASSPQANRGFVSKWAEKLLKTSKKWFSASDQQPPPTSTAAGTPAASAPAAPALPPSGAGSGLIDASAASRAAAMGQKQSENGFAGGGKGGGGGGGRVVDPVDRAHTYDADSVLALSELLGVLLRRWGSGAHASNQVMQVRG